MGTLDEGKETTQAFDVRASGLLPPTIDSTVNATSGSLHLVQNRVGVGLQWYSLRMRRKMDMLSDIEGTINTQ